MTKEEKEKLIKYLEGKIKENQKLLLETNDYNIENIYMAKIQSYENVLERIKSDKYE